MSLRTSIKSYSPFTLIFTMAGNSCRWKMVFSSTEHYILSVATNRQTWEVGRPASPAQGHTVQNHSSFSQGQQDQKQATLYRCLMGLHETWWASSTWMRKGENRAANELWLRTSLRMWHHDVPRSYMGCQGCCILRPLWSDGGHWQGGCRAVLLLQIWAGRCEGPSAHYFKANSN